MAEKLIQDENKHEMRGWISSAAVHVCLVAMMFLINIAPQPPEIPKSEIIVELPKVIEKRDLLGGGPALGLPDEGKGNNPSPGKPDPSVGSPNPRPSAEPVVPAASKPAVIKTNPAPAPPPSKPIQTTEDPNAVALRQAQEVKRRQDEEAKFRQEQDARQRRQAEEAQRQAAADAAKKEAEAKSKFGNRFGNKPGTSGGGGTGTGQGNTGKPGNQGKPDGDPDSKVLTGIGKGAGTVSGFGGRGVKNFVKLQETSNRSGTVVIYACIDANGNVTSAKFKPQGSTILDDDLVESCVSNAKRYQFKEGGEGNTCGTITYTFRVN